MNAELILGNDLKIRTYPQYAFVDAILNNEKTNSDLLCRIHIEENSKFNWDYNYLDALSENQNGDIFIRRKGLGAHKTGGFFCKCSDFKEITFEISYMQYTNVWDNISFFYTLDDIQSFESDVLYDYNFSIFCCGCLNVNVKHKREYFKNNIYENETPKWYKIKKENDIIKLFCSKDGKKWTSLSSVTVYDAKTSYVNVGFDIRLNNNQYHKWLCNNFIQIKFNDRDGKVVDYVGLMNRDWVNFAINPLIKFSFEKRDVIKKRGLWNYIKENIDEKRYLQIWLNEFYIDGLDSFKKYNYIHESLIYGYKTKNKMVSIMSFLNGKPILINVSVHTLEVAWDKADDRNYIVYGMYFLPRMFGYQLDIKHIAVLLKEYMEGKNSSEKFGYIAETDSGIFGHRIYDEIINNERAKQLFLKDVRIPFLIKEHKDCMLFRIRYLHECGVIREDNYAFLLKTMIDIAELSGIILGLVLKNRVTDNEECQNRILRYLGELSVKEKNCYKQLICELKTYLKDQ